MTIKNPDAHPYAPGLSRIKEAKIALRSRYLPFAISNDSLRNSFSFGSMSIDTRRARSPAALFPPSSCDLAFLRNFSISISSCPISSLIINGFMVVNKISLVKVVRL